MIYLSNKKILANIFVSTTNDHPVYMISKRKKRYYTYNFQFLFNSVYFNQINIDVYQMNTFKNFLKESMSSWNNL